MNSESSDNPNDHSDYKSGSLTLPGAVAMSTGVMIGAGQIAELARNASLNSAARFSVPAAAATRPTPPTPAAALGKTWPASVSPSPNAASTWATYSATACHCPLSMGEHVPGWKRMPRSFTFGFARHQFEQGGLHGFAFEQHPMNRGRDGHVDVVLRCKTNDGLGRRHAFTHTAELGEGSVDR